MANLFADGDKQPDEILNREVDFAGALATGETLSAGSASASAIRIDTGADATAALLNNPPVISGTKVRYQMKDGLDGVSYKVTVKVGTSTSQVLEADITVRVKNF